MKIVDKITVVTQEPKANIFFRLLASFGAYMTVLSHEIP